MTLDARSREILIALLTELRTQIEVSPDDPDLVRLRPPAYLDDPEADAGYQLLAGEELRTSRQASIDLVIASLGRDRVTEDELWAWIQALNGVRLVAGTQLGISDDDHGPMARVTASAEDRSLWAVYDFTTLIQHEVVEALGS